MVTNRFTSEEEKAWRTFLHASTHLFSRLDDEMREAHGERLADFDVLSNLAEAPDGQLRMSDLADQTLFSKSRITYTVTQLERRGLVQREKDKNDGRGITAALTPKGKTHHRRLARTHLQGIRHHFLDPTSPHSRSKLTAALNPILTQLDTDNPAPEPTK